MKSNRLLGINRNIVECKALYLTKSLTSLEGINRNIVECKVSCSLLLYCILHTVLIETLWNVKKVKRIE